MIPIRARVRIFVGLVLAVGVQAAKADDVGITSARLFELSDGGYALEADVAPRMVAVLRPPVVPERFDRVAKPTYRRVGAGLVVRYEFGGAGDSLEVEDVLLLPWNRSAVLMTARWRDGSVQRAMFLRDTAFIPVQIGVLKPNRPSAVEAAREHIGFGFSPGLGVAMRGLLMLGIVAIASGGFRRSLQLFLIYVAGRALALVAVDIGFLGVPPALAVSGIGIGVILLARTAVQQDQARLWPLLLVVGMVDGLGVAAGILATVIEQGLLVPALFGANLGLDLALFAMVFVVSVLWRFESERGLRHSLVAAVGSLAVAGVLIAMTGGLSTGAENRIDPADRMASARLDIRSGAGPGSAAGRATSPPKRLEKSAMIFLTVETLEVRAEVLLSLKDHLGPLGIAGSAGSVIPVEVQGEIASRAKRLVLDTFDLTIDDREVEPLLERADFVTVAATGVTSRTEPVPEPLGTSVLGVTLVYGVDRPPGEVLAHWRAFPSPSSVVPAVWADPTGSERVKLTPEEPVLRWSNDLTGFMAPPVTAVRVQPQMWPLASVLLFSIALVASFQPVRRKLGAATCCVIWPALVSAVALYPFARTPMSIPGVAGWSPSRAESAKIVDDLLTNVYRAFDLRDEEAIYDRLAVSIAGDQLSEVYLENRRALELENRGGARVGVDEVEILEAPSVRREGKGVFTVETTWTVSGSVNHFGHVHYRQNRYNAEIELIAADGVWKIREIEILEERRIL